MPKVRPLTRVEQEMQADEKAVAEVSAAFIDYINAERGRRRMTCEDMAKMFGVSRQTLFRWLNCGQFGYACVKDLARAGRRLGFRLVIEPEKK